MRITLALERNGNLVSGLLDDGFQTDALDQLELAPASLVKVKEEAFSFSALVEALTSYHPDDIEKVFDPRGQLDQGRHLFQQVFQKGGRAAYGALRQNGEVELRVVTLDEHLLRLPWVLLADEQGFLSQRDWAVTLAASRKGSDCELPPDPRMLIVAPDPMDQRDRTQAEEHLAELNWLLSAGGTRASWERSVRTVASWDEFRRTVSEFQPEVVYYYGHGEGSLDDSGLLFAAPNGQSERVSITRFANCLEGAPSDPPLLVYVNCCRGDSGGLLGAGIQLRRFVPAVVSNRTIVTVAAARLFGREFWRRVLLEGASPHAAIAGVHRKLYRHDELVDYLDWMTPVLHASYNDWESPPLDQGASAAEPYLEERFDRIEQISPVTMWTGRMIKDGRPPSYAYLWFGEKEQGPDLFHDRLVAELKAMPGVDCLQDLNPDWPPELVNSSRSFEHMYARAFDVDRLDLIPAQIRTRLTRSGKGRSCVIYLRHPVIDLTASSSDLVINIDIVTRCLQWWESHVAKYFAPPVFSILSIGFLVENAVAFGQTLQDLCAPPRLVLPSTPVWVLPPLGDVTRSQIFQFLLQSDVGIPSNDYASITEQLLRETAGKYAAMHALLASLKGDYWSLLTQPAGGPSAPPNRSTLP
jgi:hypothetical protein